MFPWCSGILSFCQKSTGPCSLPTKRIWPKCHWTIRNNRAYLRGEPGIPGSFPKDISQHWAPCKTLIPMAWKPQGLQGQLRHPGSSCLSGKEVKEETSMPMSQKNLLTHYSKGPGEWPSKHLQPECTHKMLKKKKSEALI